MEDIIEQLILKKRREIYKVLNAGKAVKPIVYFIIELNGSPSEIIVPGCERFFESDRAKDFLAEYIQHKWTEYSKRPGIKLLATVLVSDAWHSSYEKEEGETDEQALDRYEKAIGSPSRDPKRIEVLTFSVCFEEYNKLYMYPHRRKGKHIEFYEEPELPSGASGGEGRFANIFPKL